MLSKKMTFSLMSLITLLVFVFVAPSAMAQVKVTVSGLTSVPHLGTAGSPAATTVDIVVETDKNAAMPTLTGVIFDKDGNLLVDSATPPVAISPDFDLNEAMENTAKKRYITMTVPANAITADNIPLRVVVTIPAIGPSDPSDDTDDSAIAYRAITITEIVDTTGHPTVVSIQRLRPGSQTVVAAFQEATVTAPSFDVRIVFTEKWNVDTAKVADILKITNGVASNVVEGVPFARVGSTIADNADPSALLTARSQTLSPHPTEGVYWHDNSQLNGLAGVPRPTHADIATANTAGDLIPLPTGSDEMYWQYRVTITPHQKSDETFDIKISVNAFNDGGNLLRQFYLPADVGSKPNGREELRLKVKGTSRNLTAGYKVVIDKDIRIPGGGYLVIAQNIVGSEVVEPPGSKKDAPKATERRPAQMLYNVIGAATLPNLATAFQNGVVLDIQSPHAGLIVSEVMWGEDVSLNPSSNSQYIELYNPGGDYVTAADADHTPAVNEALTLVFYGPNEFSAVPAKTAVAATATTAATMALPAGVTDRIGTLDATGAYWNPAGKGQSGRSGTDAADTAAARGDFVPVVDIVSMYRAMVPDTSVGAAVGAMKPAEDGQMAASWATSAGPKSANFDPLAIGIRHGTPGAATDATDTPADTAAEAKAKTDAAAAAAKKTASTGTIPVDGQIYISEIMVAGGGILPQWIEIANGSDSETVNLSGWTLTVDNAAADADVSIGASAKFTIPAGTTVDARAQQKTPSTILVVTEAGRNNVDGSGQVLDLMKSNEVDLILAGVVTRKYTLLSDMAFMVTLAPPEPAKSTPPTGETAGAKATREAAEKKAAAKRKAATDMVGNLGADGAAAWALPMDEDGRSSIIRRHVQVGIGAAVPEDGTMATSWVLASETSFAAPTHIRASSYYGAANDVGTPGFRAGGALPVELSHFRPARDKVTDAVVITWSTQSELNNAGFFIKRSQQRDGEFKIINAAMIPGAGTTSEKQFYTYNDTTAQPNVVYYYQIEDVSLDGNRQTLTNGIRLKGHVSVAGKLTTLWGDLKTSQ